mgnify:CR=1 FL=1
MTGLHNHNYLRFFSLYTKKTKRGHLSVPCHPEADEPFVEAGGLRPGHVEGLVLEQVVLHLVANLSPLLIQLRA